jgi:signal transduction histidine kinase
MPVSPRGHRKQILLFLLAVILPSLVLVVFALRMISQEHELAQKRMKDERRRLAGEIGHHLLVRLEKIKLQESSAAANWTQLSVKRDYVNPEVVLIGMVEGDRLLLPWEENKRSEEFRRLLSRSDFSRKIQLAESEEFAKKDFIRAAGLYRQLMESAQESPQRGYARLLLARALAKADRKKEALSHYRRILDLPSSVTDEYGIPLSLYAAGPLLDAGAGYGEVLECIRVELGLNRWLSPAELYMLQELAEKLVNTAPEESLKDTAKDYQRLINEHILELEQALELQGDFQKIAFTAKQENQGRRDEPIWISYGEIPWLVSLGPSLAGSQPLLFVVHAQDILASLRRDSGFSETFPGEFHLVTGESSEGESLGPNFRGLKIAFAESEDTALSKQWSFQRSFYLLALLLVLSVTLFGAYLLWRDVRRDVRMAEMRSQFVSSVSHELKTPLTAIRMFAETLRLGRSRNLKTQAEYLDTIVSESQRLTRLLNNVLDFSKIEQGKRIYKPELTSLSEIIQASARAMKYPLSQQGFELNVRAEEGLPDVRVDKDALEQAILNLLNNAMKYSGESREIDLRLQRKDDQALIQVTDRGVGIDPREQKRIFEKFYRVPMAENERIVGTGLGLTLVSHIVKAHGGNIEVESAPGKGSTFSIYLPLESKQ